MSKFHERLNLLREERKVTQATMAEAFGITSQSLSYYMNGREPKYDLLVKIAEFFEVSTDYLLGQSDNKVPENCLITEELGLNDEAIATFKFLLDNPSDESKNMLILLDKIIADQDLRVLLKICLSYVGWGDPAQEIYNFLLPRYYDADTNKELYKKVLNSLMGDILSRILDKVRENESDSKCPPN